VAEQGIDQVVRRTLDLALGQGLRRQHLHAPGQRLGRLGQHERVGRAGEQEAARHGVAVDLALERGEQPGRRLHLVDHGEAGGTVHQGRRVGSGQFGDHRVVQRQVPYTPLGHDRGDNE